jgi:ribosomal protein S19E (S16A)
MPRSPAAHGGRCARRGTNAKVVVGDQDWERKELEKLAQKGLIEQVNSGWGLSNEGTNFLARSEVVLVERPSFSW